MAVLHGWRVCPRCASELHAAESGLECPACGSAYYANSAPTACALVVDDAGRLLLGRRAFPPFEGCWDTPGGFLEEGEHPLDALRRELLEETGLIVEPDVYVGCWMDVYGDAPEAQATLNLYWTAHIVGGELHAADDVAELAWFDPDELPPDDQVAFTNVAEVLRAWRRLTDTQ